MHVYMHPPTSHMCMDASSARPVDDSCIVLCGTQAFAVKGAADEAKLHAERERLLMLDTISQTESRYKEQLVVEFKRGHEVRACCCCVEAM